MTTRIYYRCVDQYWPIEGDDEESAGSCAETLLIVSDIRSQIYEHWTGRHRTIHIVQKIILFRRFVNNIGIDGRVRFDRPSRRSNIRSTDYRYRKATTQRNALTVTRSAVPIILEEDRMSSLDQAAAHQLACSGRLASSTTRILLRPHTQVYGGSKAANEVTAADVDAKAA
jgi:hypothetical protein